MKIKDKGFIKLMIFKTVVFVLALALAALTVRVITNNTDGRRQIVDEDGGQEISLPVPSEDDKGDFSYE